MTAGKRRICIVSSGCLSTGPRVVKEADALSDAGHRVHVVVRHWMPRHPEWDARLAAGRAWTWSAVSARRVLGVPHPSVLAGKALVRVARAAARITGPLAPVDELALGDASLPLLAHATGRVADLFIAHNLAALSVVAQLSARGGVPFAFDAEDDHLAELPAEEQRTLEGRLRDALLSRYLPRCAYVSAASDGIADNMAVRYGIPRPTVVHNAFPWSLREAFDGARRDRVPGGLSLYWCSQSLGLDRGLRDAVGALGFLSGDTHLHLRADGPESVRDALVALAREVGVAGRLHFHPQVHPDELPSRTAEHDVGLALETMASENKQKTVTNKLFLYLLSGLAVAATDTSGQRGVMETIPEAGFLYTPGDVAGLAKGLRRFGDDPASLARAKRAALVAAQERWSWERERTGLVEVVERALRFSARA